MPRSARPQTPGCGARLGAVRAGHPAAVMADSGCRAVSCRVLDSIGGMDAAGWVRGAQRLVRKPILHFGSPQQDPLPAAPGERRAPRRFLHQRDRGGSKTRARADRARPAADEPERKGHSPAARASSQTAPSSGSPAVVWRSCSSCSPRLRWCAKGRRPTASPASLPSTDPASAPRPERPWVLRVIAATALYLEDLHLPHSSIPGSLGGGFRLDGHAQLRPAAHRRRMPGPGARAVAPGRAARHEPTPVWPPYQHPGHDQRQIAAMATDLCAAESMLYLITGFVDLHARRPQPGRARFFAGVGQLSRPARCWLRGVRTAMEVAAGRLPLRLPYVSATCVTAASSSSFLAPTKCCAAASPGPA